MGKYKVTCISTYGTKNFRENCGIATFCEDFMRGLATTFPGEFVNFNVAAITEGKRSTELPVEFVIDKYDSDSWRIIGNRIETKVIESRIKDVKDLIVYQYEGGLYPEFNHEGKLIPGEHDGYSPIAYLKRFSSDPNTLQFVQMHTILPIEKANERYTRNMKGFGKYADGIMVMIEDSKKILVKEYDIDPIKINIIPHGIRINEESQEEARTRLNMPKELFLASEPGLRSLNKGNHNFIAGYAKFVDQCLNKKQREMSCSLLAGQIHPTFSKQERGKYLKIYNQEMEKISKKLKIHNSKIRIQKIEDITQGDYEKNDLIILDSFMPTLILLGVYSASDIIITPYPGLEQSSSGAGADAEGAGTPLVSTKTKWACENINPNSKTPEKGMIITDRGILIDNGKFCVPQIAAALSYMMFSNDESGELARINMGHKSYEAGRSKIWPSVSGSFLEFIQATERRKESPTPTQIPKTKHPKELEDILNQAHRRD